MFVIVHIGQMTLGKIFPRKMKILLSADRLLSMKQEDAEPVGDCCVVFF